MELRNWRTTLWTQTPHFQIAACRIALFEAAIDKNWHHLLRNVVVLCWATSRYNVNFTREEDVLEGEEEESAGGKGAVSVQLFLVFVVVHY